MDDCELNYHRSQHVLWQSYVFCHAACYCILQFPYLDGPICCTSVQLFTGLFPLQCRLLNQCLSLGFCCTLCRAKARKASFKIRQCTRRRHRREKRSSVASRNLHILKSLQGLDIKCSLLCWYACFSAVVVVGVLLCCCCSLAAVFVMCVDVAVATVLVVLAVMSFGRRRRRRRCQF